MPKKSAFNKDNSITFKLVHRSQQDPLVADGTAPQNVLCPTGGKSKKKSQQREEQVKFGIYYDDDYDYLQHLRPVREEPSKDVGWEPVATTQKKKKEPKILLPSSVFASEFQEKDGMLDRAVGPQPGWDPEIVAALDDDFDFDNPENQLEDDFFTKMMTDEDGDEESDDEDDDFEDVSDDDTITSGKDEKRMRTFSEDETKSCFSNYSMTSSIMRRNQGLTDLDTQFEALFEKEYADDTDIGCLAEGDVNGYIDVNKSELIKKLIGDKKKEEQDRVYVNQMIGERFAYEELGNETVVPIEVDESGKHAAEDEFDCQSIISTYSNLYNHPKMIYETSKKVRIDPKTGIPILPKPGLTVQNLKELDAQSSAKGGATEDGRSDRTRQSRISQLSIRDKDETPEERKARKEALREFRRERRLEKKANQMCFKLEEKRQVKEMINVQQNLAAVKLC